MTPMKKDTGHTVLRMERLKKADLGGGGAIHVAGGNHQGIIINKHVTPSKCFYFILSLSLLG